MQETATDPYIRLDRLAQHYGTDKASTHHDYTRVYGSVLADRIDTVRGLLELGVGGKNYRGVVGSSLQTWRDFLPHAQIVGVDIDPAAAGDYGDRITVVIGDQTRRSVLEKALGFIPSPDVIIDDGSHINTLTIASFHYLFGRLSPGGIYVIEDTQCASELRLGNYRTQIEVFVLEIMRAIETNGRIMTRRNAADFYKISEDYVLTELERWVDSISIHRGLYIIRKRSR
jgi:hypothetical protein